MVSELQACSAAYPLVFLGVVGFVASIVSLLLAWTARAELARYVGPMTLALGVLTVGLGLLATRHDLGRTEAAASSPNLSAEDAARMREVGEREAKTCTMTGAQSGGMPLLAGLAATIVAFGRARARRA